MTARDFMKLDIQETVEIRRALAYAQQRCPSAYPVGCTFGTVDGSNWLEVTFHFWEDETDSRLPDVTVDVYLPDRRRSHLKEV